MDRSASRSTSLVREEVVQSEAMWLRVHKNHLTSKHEHLEASAVDRSPEQSHVMWMSDVPSWQQPCPPATLLDTFLLPDTAGVFRLTRYPMCSAYVVLYLDQIVSTEPLQFSTEVCTTDYACTRGFLCLSCFLSIFVILHTLSLQITRIFFIGVVYVLVGKATLCRWVSDWSVNDVF